MRCHESCHLTLIYDVTPSFSVCLINKASVLTITMILALNWQVLANMEQYSFETVLLPLTFCWMRKPVTNSMFFDIHAKGCIYMSLIHVYKAVKGMHNLKAKLWELSTDVKHGKCLLLLFWHDNLEFRKFWVYLKTN